MNITTFLYICYSDFLRGLWNIGIWTRYICFITIRIQTANTRNSFRKYGLYHKRPVCFTRIYTYERRRNLVVCRGEFVSFCHQTFKSTFIIQFFLNNTTSVVHAWAQKSNLSSSWVILLFLRYSKLFLFWYRVENRLQTMLEAWSQGACATLKYFPKWRT